jgi:hypothetical protein
MRKLVAFVILAAAAMTMDAGAVSAGPKPGEPCIRHDGVNLNELYGISDRIITRSCTQAYAGERWVQPAVWIVNTSFEAVPAEFVPTGATPLEDFVAKLAAVKYVVDAGTKHERTYVIPSGDRLWIGELDGFPAANTVTLGSLNPLSVGSHTVAVYWIFDGMHCDGFVANAVENCFPAGETFYTATAFDVAPRSGR